MSVSIKYKGAEIASASTNVTKTIKTSGKYCEGDIEVINTPDGGDAPVINSLSVTANGTYTAPSGVDGYSPINVNVPQGITPSGNINITDANVTDVTNYATAQVVDADLVAENIKKNVNILGVVGSFEGGGGGSLPSSITKIDGGSFTPANNENAETYHINHNLGELPKYCVVWTESLTEGTPAETNYAVIYGMIRVGSLWFNPNNEFYAKVSVIGRTREGYAQDGTNQGTQAQLVNFASTTYFAMRKSGYYFKAGVTYKWLAWA